MGYNWKINKGMMSGKLPWLCVGLIGFVFVFLFSYTDQANTVRQSIVFMDEIISGNFTGGYQAVIDLVGTERNWNIPAVYEPFAYIITGMFSFPIVLLHHFGVIGLPTASYNGLGDWWFLLIVKMQQLILIMGTAGIVYNICKLLGKEKGEAGLGALYFLSGTSFLYYALAVGQMEIYVVFFSLLGIMFWIKKEHKKFLFCFALAIPIKMFALLIFFPLLLIREKRIWKIAADFLTGCSIWVIFKALFCSDVAYRISTAEPSQRMLDVMFSKTIAGGNSHISSIPIFLMIFLIICLFLYFTEIKENEEIYGIYVPFVIYAFFFSFVGSYPYWIVLITPFLPILMAYDAKKRNGNMLVASIVGVCYNISVIFGHSWAFGSKCVNTGFAPTWFGQRALSDIKYVSVADIFQNTIIAKLLPLFVTVYVVGLLWLIIYNNPFGVCKDRIIELKFKGILYFRIFAIVPFLILMLYAYYSVKDLTIIDTTKVPPMTAGWNLVSKESAEFGKDTLMQEISFEEEYQLTNLKLWFKRNGNTYEAYSSLFIELVDLEEDQVLYSKRVGYNELIWEYFTEFDLGEIEVRPNRNYAVKLYTEDAQEKIPIHITLTETDILPDSNAWYMGQDSGHDLYMVIEGKYK